MPKQQLIINSTKCTCTGWVHEKVVGPKHSLLDCLLDKTLYIIMTPTDSLAVY